MAGRWNQVVRTMTRAAKVLGQRREGDGDRGPAWPHSVPCGRRRGAILRCGAPGSRAGGPQRTWEVRASCGSTSTARAQVDAAGGFGSGRYRSSSPAASWPGCSRSATRRCTADMVRKRRSYRARAAEAIASASAGGSRRCASCCSSVPGHGQDDDRLRAGRRAGPAALHHPARRAHHQVHGRNRRQAAADLRRDPAYARRVPVRRVRRARRRTPRNTSARSDAY